MTRSLPGGGIGARVESNCLVLTYERFRIRTEGDLGLPLRLMDCTWHESPAGDDLLPNAVASLLRMGARAAESEPLLRVCGESHRGFESHPIRQVVLIQTQSRKTK